MDNFKFQSADKFSIFGTATPLESEQTQGAIEIPHEKLHHYRHHKYIFRKDELFSDLVENVKACGVLMPLLVQPLENDEYEILAGHRRYEASKEAEIPTVPCIIMEDLTEEEARMIVHVTNVNQRTLTAYSHSERAAIIADYHEAIKAQGKRTDLIKGIEEALENNEQSKENQSSTEKFGLSKTTIARYLRINALLPEFKEMIDGDKLKIRSAVELSYIDHDNQMNIYNYIADNDLKIDFEKAKILRQTHAESGKIAHKDLESIFTGKEKQVKSAKNIAIGRIKIANYFSDDETTENIESTIISALEFYFKHKKNTENKGANE